jgi:hypothetical protein
MLAINTEHCEAAARFLFVLAFRLLISQFVPIRERFDRRQLNWLTTMDSNEATTS